MKVNLSDGYFIDIKSPVNNVLKQRYKGIRNKVETECEKTISYHRTYKDAVKAFADIMVTLGNVDGVIEANDYLNRVEAENAKLEDVLQYASMQKFFISTPIVQNKKEHSILKFIGFGEKNAVSRKMLVMLCVNEGLVNANSNNQDRATRDLINKARKDGHIIIYLPYGQGYCRLSNDMKLTENEANALHDCITHETNKYKSGFANLKMPIKLYEDYKSGRL